MHLKNKDRIIKGSCNFIVVHFLGVYHLSFCSLDHKLSISKKILENSVIFQCKSSLENDVMTSFFGKNVKTYIKHHTSLFLLCISEILCSSLPFQQRSSQYCLSGHISYQQTNRLIDHRPRGKLEKERWNQKRSLKP